MDRRPKYREEMIYLRGKIDGYRDIIEQMELWDNPQKKNG